MYAGGTFKDAEPHAEFFILSPEALLGPARRLPLMAEDANAWRNIKVTQKARSCCPVLPTPQHQKKG